MTVHPFSSEYSLGNPRAAFPTPFSLCARAIGISKFVTCRSARTLDLKVPGVTKQTRVLGIDSDMERAEFNSKTVSDTCEYHSASFFPAHFHVIHAFSIALAVSFQFICCP